ncbi:uridylate kinase [Thermosporothrix hazakensis]|jgi:uridylate kinase|uniref:UMP kinase n=1 Tax=Thermosporothrix hazakensis TaxID=644383 RepID=A0A326UBV0_THEHA|nr:UMP kinase [Thermosporothrix hazakensis]PZW35977.1 uridylate kinase [Thermosporothrix hazakensis]GCE46632.1 uridylate kinase [Thermosporothrix hazakensis]
MTQNRPEAHVIKLGGSLIVPDGGINVPFLKEFNAFIRRQVTERGRRFFLFVGGGRLARHYRDAGAEITGHELASDDLDWLGVHATRLNAHLFRTIFRDIAHPAIIKDYSYIHKPEKPVVIAAGWRPGWSTDYVAAVLAQDYHIKTIVKMSNTDFIYDKDPRTESDAKPIERISWADYRAIVGDTWEPGANAPFDPIASKLASELSLRVIYLNGLQLANVEKALDNEPFTGTVIS